MFLTVCKSWSKYLKLGEKYASASRPSCYWIHWKFTFTRIPVLISFWFQSANQFPEKSKLSNFISLHNYGKQFSMKQANPARWWDNFWENPCSGKIPSHGIVFSAIIIIWRKIIYSACAFFNVYLPMARFYLWNFYLQNVAKLPYLHSKKWEILFSKKEILMIVVK